MQSFLGKAFMQNAKSNTHTKKKQTTSNKTNICCLSGGLAYLDTR